MNVNRGLLIGIVAGVIVSAVLVFSNDFSQVEAQMGGMGGGGMSHGSSDGSSSSGMMSGGMMGSGGGPSRHGVFYAPGSVHQICHKGGEMPPHYCEPYYKAMSSVPGVKITTVEPIDEKTLQVTLREINIGGQGVNQKISVSAGAGDLVGTGVVDGGWSGTTTVNVPLNGMGHVYMHKSMHVHIFPVTSG